jgi:hypothetical protein
MRKFWSSLCLGGLLFRGSYGHLPFDHPDIQPDQRLQFLVAVYLLEGPEGQTDPIDRTHPVDLDAVAFGLGQGLPQVRQGLGVLPL